MSDTNTNQNDYINPEGPHGDEKAEEEEEPAPANGPNGEHYYLLKFLHSSETLLGMNTLSQPLVKGDKVVAPSRYGKDMAEVLGKPNHPENYSMEEAKEIVRQASEEDLEKYEENLSKEKEALEICKEKAVQHKLEMKLVSAHYLLDEPKILFFFTADSRVDFRELVKDLVSVFKMRIELRQIGVRDESRVLGGLAVCGRKYCCHSITDKLNPVSIKMAKEQDLSLNSMKISGPCGRLLCCLAYEYDFYKEAKSKVPKEGNRIRYNKEEYKVQEINILSRRAVLTTGDGGMIEVSFERFSWDKNTLRWEADLDGIFS